MFWSAAVASNSKHAQEWVLLQGDNERLSGGHSDPSGHIVGELPLESILEDWSFHRFFDSGLEEGQYKEETTSWRYKEVLPSSFDSQYVTASAHPIRSR